MSIEGLPPPAPVPGPEEGNIPTPDIFQVGAIKRDPQSSAVAVKTDLVSIDGTLEWAVMTVDYGGYYAGWGEVWSWDDVGYVPYAIGSAGLFGSGFLHVVINQYGVFGRPAFEATGVFSVEFQIKSPATLAGAGSLSAVVGAVVLPAFSSAGRLAELYPTAPGKFPAFGSEGTLDIQVITGGTAYQSAGLTGGGALSADAYGNPASPANFASVGTLAVTVKPIIPLSNALSGGGALTTPAVMGFVVPTGLSGGGALSAVVNQVYPVSGQLAGGGGLATPTLPRRFFTPQLSGDGSLSATASIVFSPSTETNIARSNEPVPPGCSGCYVTLIGGGGRGGSGYQSSYGTPAGGGGGGGGGGQVNRSFIPKAYLGAYYSVTVGVEQGTSRFTSGSVDWYAYGGSQGSSGGTPSAGGAGGSYYATGYSASAQYGGNGGAGAYNASAGSGYSPNGGGGGYGVAALSGGWPYGVGAGNGGYGGSSAGAGGQPGNGYGGGGGGGAGGQGQAAGQGGLGYAGSTKVEWV